MKSSDSDSPLERTVSGTPLDYSEDLYRIYIETADVGSSPEQVLRAYLGPEHGKNLRRLLHGFEFIVPIQCVPEIVRLLTLENIAVYQVVRQSRVDGRWR
jgi:hypothetical protein